MHAFNCLNFFSFLVLLSNLDVRDPENAEIKNWMS